MRAFAAVDSQALQETDRRTSAMPADFIMTEQQKFLRNLQTFDNVFTALPKALQAVLLASRWH